MQQQLDTSVVGKQLLGTGRGHGQYGNLPSFQSQGMLLCYAGSGHQRERAEAVQVLHTSHEELIQAPSMSTKTEQQRQVPGQPSRESF